MEKDKKGLVKRYNGRWDSPDGSYVVWDSRFPVKGSREDKSFMDRIKKMGEILSGDLSAFRRDTLGIWRRLKPAYGFSNNYNQAAIQAFLNLKEGDHVYWYDIETLGTAPFHRKENSLQFYSPTEIALMHTQYINGKFVPQENSLSLLIRPDDQVLEELEQRIVKLKAGNWIGLTEDEWRTLAALTVYADESLYEKKTIFGKEVRLITGQRRDLYPLKGTVLSSAKNIALMEKGLEMLKQGTVPDDAFFVIARTLKGRNHKLAGYNVLGFDQPLFLDYINSRLGKDVPDSKVQWALMKLKRSLMNDHIDPLHIVRALGLNPFTKFGVRMTLEAMSERFGHKNEMAHFALADVKTSIDVANRLFKDKTLFKTAQTGKGRVVSIDHDPIKTGDILFGKAGMASKDTSGKHEFVFRMRNGQFVPAYDGIRPNPIYKNAIYRVQNFFEKFEIDGKPMFGIHLYNESDDLHHFIFREHLSDLQNVIQKHLEYVEQPSEQLKEAHFLQNIDRANRKWRKMFEGEGNALKQAKRFLAVLNIIRKGEAEGLTEEQIRTRIFRSDPEVTDEFIRDVKTLRKIGVLESQEDFLKRFVKAIKRSPIRSKEDFEAQNVAFAEMARLIKETFGTSEVKMSLPNGVKALPLEIDGVRNQILLSSVETIRGGLYGALYRGHIERPAPSILRKRFDQIIEQLKEKDKRGAEIYDRLSLQFKRIPPDESIDTILTELAQNIYATSKRKKSFGVDHIMVEAPIKVENTVSKIVQEELIQKAIHAGDLFKRGRNKKIALKFEGKADELIQIHKKAVEEMLRKSRLDQTRVDLSRVRDPYKSLERLVDTYRKQGFHTQFKFDPDKNALYFAVSKEPTALNKSLKDLLLSDNNVAVVQIPLINEKEQIQYKTQNRVVRPKITMENGKATLVTSFEEVIDRLAANAYRAKRIVEQHDRLGMKGDMLEIHRMLNRTPTNALKSLSMNNKFLNPNDAEDIFQIRSERANWVRGGFIDVAELSRRWYEEQYRLLHPNTRKELGLRDPEAIAQELKPGQTFMDAMPMKVKVMFQQDVVEMLKEFGIHADFHSVKGPHATSGLLSTRDVRQLLPFGYFSPMGRENIFKSVNYIALDRENVIRSLMVAGKNSAEIEAMTKSSLITDVDLQFQHEMSHIEGLAIYMNDYEIAQRIKELRTKEGMNRLIQEIEEKFKAGQISESMYKEVMQFIKTEKKYPHFLKMAEAFSTFEGMSIVSKDIQGALDITREKRIKLSEGAELSQEIIERIERDFGEFDITKDYVFDHGISVMDLFKKDRLVVSRLAENGLVADDWKHWNHDVVIKGWDAQERTLILEQFDAAINSTKLLTTGAHRLTATFLPKPLLYILAGEEVEMILPHSDLKKAQWGEVIDRTIRGYAQVMKRQIARREGKFGSTGARIQDGFELIAQNMKKHLGLTDAMVKIMNDQIVVSSMIGRNEVKEITADQLLKFSKAMDAILGTNYAGRIGGVGLGRHDVWTWEDSSVDENDGVVKYGPKELSMIETKLSRMRDKGFKVGNLVHDWYQQYIRDLNQPIKGLLEGMGRIATLEKHYAPTSGDVVIRTTGEAFTSGDTVGRITQQGVREISMHAIRDIPDITSKDTKLVTEDYLGTIADFGRIQGKFDDDVTFSDAISARKGVAFLELPDDQFSRKYVPIVDVGSITKRSNTEIPIFNEIEKNQIKLWRLIKEFQSLTTNGNATSDDIETVRGEIENLIKEHEARIAHIVDSSRDESIYQKYFSARLGFAGRFRIQSVNSFLNYEKIDGKWKQTGMYKESHFYISRGRAKELINQGNLAETIAHVWGEDLNRFKVLNEAGEKVLDKNALVEYILDNLNKKGLYGLTNRYPTINESVVQAVRIMIDPNMHYDSREARITLGTITRTKGDTDGDVYALLLSHYQEAPGVARDIHVELAKMARYDARLNRAKAQELMSELESVAKQENIPLHQLMTDEKYKDLRGLLFEAKAGRLYELESMVARLQNQFIGPIDNLRNKYFEFTKSFYKTLDKFGLPYENRLAAVEELGRAFSQDSISAKKTSGVNIALEFMKQGHDRTEAIRLAEQKLENQLKLLSSTIELFATPDRVNVHEFVNNLHKLGIVNNQNRHLIEQGAKEIQMMYEVSGALGGVRNPSLGLAISEGLGPEKLQKALTGKYGAFPTRIVEQMIDLLGEHGAQLREAVEATQKKIAYNYQKYLQERPLENIEGILSGEVVEDAGTTMGDMLINEEERVGVREALRRMATKSGTRSHFSLGFASGLFGAWAVSAMLRDGPTPEAMQERESVMSHAVKDTLGIEMPKPTARISPSGEHVSISISAKTAKNLSEQEIASIVHDQLKTMTGLSMNMNLNVNDNTKELSEEWLKEAVANALNTGFAYT